MSIYSTLWRLKFPRYGDDHLSGSEYATVPFGQLHDMICNALRGHRPRLLAESWRPDARGRLLFDDGSAQDIESGRV